MKGSILFNPDINIEVDVDPSAEEGSRLVSAKNLVDGQEAGGGSGESDYSTAHLTINCAGASNQYILYAPVNDKDSDDNEFSSYCGITTGPYMFKFDVILYKGAAEYMLDIDDGSNVPTYQLSGNIEAEAPDGSTGKITGNAVIVITDA